MTIEIILPELGAGITKATMACWHVAVGDHIQKGQEVCEVVTDKASFVIDAPCEGKLLAINVAKGQEAAVRSALGTIGKV